MKGRVVFNGGVKLIDYKLFLTLKGSILRFLDGVYGPSGRRPVAATQDSTRATSRSVSKMVTGRCACASTSRPTSAGGVKSALTKWI